MTTQYVNLAGSVDCVGRVRPDFPDGESTQGQRVRSDAIKHANIVSSINLLARAVIACLIFTQKIYMHKLMEQYY